MTMQERAPNWEVHLTRIGRKTDIVGQVGTQSKTIIVGLGGTLRYSTKHLKKKNCVILGRDFLLINRNLQPSLETDETFQFFFHRVSISVVEVRARISFSKNLWIVIWKILCLNPTLPPQLR